MITTKVGKVIFIILVSRKCPVMQTNLCSLSYLNEHDVSRVCTVLYTNVFIITLLYYLLILFFTECVYSHDIIIFHWMSIQKLLNEISPYQVLSPVWENNWCDLVPHNATPHDNASVLLVPQRNIASSLVWQRFGPQRSPNLGLLFSKSKYLNIKVL